MTDSCLSSVQGEQKSFTSMFSTARWQHAACTAQLSWKYHSDSSPLTSCNRLQETKPCVWRKQLICLPYKSEHYVSFTHHWWWGSQSAKSAFVAVTSSSKVLLPSSSPPSPPPPRHPPPPQPHNWLCYCYIPRGHKVWRMLGKASEGLSSEQGVSLMRQCQTPGDAARLWSTAAGWATGRRISGTHDHKRISSRRANGPRKKEQTKWADNWF